mgnify:CR=1
MNNFDSKVQELRRIGVESFDIFTKDELAFLTDENYRIGDFNKRLAGHLKQEYQLKWPEEFEVRLHQGIRSSELLKEYIDTIKLNNAYSYLSLTNLWVNYQAKHEFNPVHDHSGVLSFIIFLQVPYDLTAEENMFNANISETSKLQFLTTNNLGEIIATTVPVDQSYVNKLLMFPSKLRHQVYPFFTSNEHRITVSGNFCYDINQKVE